MHSMVISVESMSKAASFSVSSPRAAGTHAQSSFSFAQKPATCSCGFASTRRKALLPRPAMERAPVKVASILSARVSTSIP